MKRQRKRLLEEEEHDIHLGCHVNRQAKVNPDDLFQVYLEEEVSNPAPMDHHSQDLGVVCKGRAKEDLAR